MENNLGFEKVFAVADIKGSKDYPDINGRVFGSHIHEGTSCTGNNNDLFADAKGHYNPDNCIHPMHAGDMPDDFKSQPSGDSGTKIACGKIYAM